MVYAYSCTISGKWLNCVGGLHTCLDTRNNIIDRVSIAILERLPPTNGKYAIMLYEKGDFAKLVQHLSEHIPDVYTLLQREVQAELKLVLTK